MSNDAYAALFVSIAGWLVVGVLTVGALRDADGFKDDGPVEAVLLAIVVVVIWPLIWAVTGLGALSDWLRKQ